MKHGKENKGKQVKRMKHLKHETSLVPQSSRNNLQNCKGSILTISILMTAIVALFAGALAQLVLQDAATVYRQENSMKAFFLAQAGVSEAYAILKEDLSNKDDADLYPETSLGDGSYDVTILQPNGKLVIQSVGIVKNVERAIYVEVKADDGLAAFDYGILSNKEGDLWGSSTINADIHSNEEWDLKGVTVNGTVSAVGDVDLSGNAFAESIQENASTLPFPTFDFNYFYNLAAPQDRYTGDQDWNSVNLQPVNGVVYVNGNVKIRGSSTLTGVLVATGEIDIGGNFEQFSIFGMPALMSRDDDIILHGNVEIGEGMIYTGTGSVEIRGNVTTTGNIFSFDEFIGHGSLELSAATFIPEGVTSTTEEGLLKLTYHE